MRQTESTEAEQHSVDEFHQVAADWRAGEPAAAAGDHRTQPGTGGSKSCSGQARCQESPEEQAGCVTGDASRLRQIGPPRLRINSRSASRGPMNFAVAGTGQLRTRDVPSVKPGDAGTIETTRIPEVQTPPPTATRLRRHGSGDDANFRQSCRRSSCGNRSVESPTGPGI